MIDIDWLDTSAFHRIVRPSRWDNPLQMDMGNSDPSQRMIPEVDIIRSNQLELLPHISSLRQAALEVASSVDPADVDKLRQVLTFMVFYRLPDLSNWANFYVRQIDDFPVLVETTGQNVSPIADLIFPVRPIAEVHDREDMLTTDAKLKTFRKKYGLIGSHTPPEEQRVGRVVFPNLCQALENWIAGMDGPIWNVRYAAAPAERMERDISVNFRHAPSYERLGRARHKLGEGPSSLN